MKQPASAGAPGSSERLAVVLLGVAACLLFIGYRALIPSNIAWLDHGDPAQHFLGWHFFRHAPWTFPLGLNPPNGLEVSNAIVYSDAIPLLALLFKTVSAALPPVFQYLGLWLLACFILQAWFGWKLAGLATDRPLLRVLIAALFVSAPPMLFRAPHHLALSGHFLILAAIYLVLRPNRRHQAGFWGLLLVVAALVNAYLLLMAAACWAADVVHGALWRREPWRRVALQVVATLAAIGLALWQAGYFSESEPGTGGFGLYRFNLLSLIDSSGWSYVLPDIPGGPGDYEGFNFLGLGVLLLALVAVAVLIAGRVGIARRIARYPALLAILLMFAVYAASNNIGLGPVDVAVPMPHFLLQATGVFRASGRIFWPVYYVLLFVIAYLVVRGVRPRFAVPLLALAVVVQVADTSVNWRDSRAAMMTEPASTWSTALTDPFWEAAAARYDAVRRIVPVNVTPIWKDMSYYAATHRMGTDIVYLARLGQHRQAKAQRRALQAASTGRYRPDSLYVVAPEHLAIVAAALDPATDLLARVDDLYVVAPGWNACPECPALATPLPAAELMPISPRGSTILFNSDAAGTRHLLSGWWPPEPWGVWSSGHKAAALLRAPQDLTSLTITAEIFAPDPSSRQRVIVSLNGVKAAYAELPGGTQTIDVPVTDEIRATFDQHTPLVIGFRLPDAVSPMAAGLSTDQRALALGLTSMTLN